MARTTSAYGSCKKNVIKFLVKRKKKLGKEITKSLTIVGKMNL